MGTPNLVYLLTRYQGGEEQSQARRRPREWVLAGSSLPEVVLLPGPISPWLRPVTCTTMIYERPVSSGSVLTNQLCHSTCSHK